MTIEVRNLRYRYPGNSRDTIQGVDFHIGRGEIFGFLGPSGAGKSTLQKILIGILKKYDGQAKVLGRELRGTDADYYSRIGVAFEFPNFYTRFTALENLAFFGSLYPGADLEDPLGLLARVGLDKWARTKVADFSKGMRMRLNLCRALLHKPELLFLDEPTSGLDPSNVKVVKELLLEHKARGGTVLITTHNMSIAEQICDRVAFMVDGGIPLVDSPRNLMLARGRKRLLVEYAGRGDGTAGRAEFDLDGLGHNREFQRLLQEGDVETMHTQETTLEQIFIEVTGRKLS